MQVLIDNQDGLGSVDYTACVQFGKKATIVRQLNKPSLCTLSVVVGANGLAVPVVQARLSVVSASGTTIFSGYLPASPELQLVGQGITGGLYTALVSACSLEVLLDATAVLSEATLLGGTAQQNWMYLNAVAATPMEVSIASQVPAGGRVEVLKGARWSEAAEMLASSTRSAYRLNDGSLTVVPMGELTHTVAMDAPGLQMEALQVKDLRLLATDVTLCGREEPTAYVTEVFVADGITTKFSLSEKPFSPATKQKTSIADLFQGTILNQRLWALSDAAGHIALNANGLSCTGGTGRDAETTVASVQLIEMGGNVTVEGGAVQISSGGAGIVLGFYEGTVTAANCFAGFGVSTTGGVVNVTPMVNGVAAGSVFQPQAGHLYTFRLRFMSPEMERVRQTYYFAAGATSGATGGEVLVAGGWLEFEIQDVTSGLPGAPVVLYSGEVSNVPPACVLGLMDSGSLLCSMRSVTCTQSGPVVVQVGTTGSQPAMQYQGTAVDGASCHVTTTGTLEFYPGSVPAAGLMIYVSYRVRARAVARRIAAATTVGGNAAVETMWVGTVSAPIAWSSVDCDNAAAALLSSAGDSTVSLRGKYTSPNLQATLDVWPGDALLMVPFADDVQHNAIVREVRITLAAALPDALQYEVTFANDWAESLSIRLSTTVPLDVVLPQQATAFGGALESLSGLTINNLTGSVLSVTTGLTAPVNGGFEIRRRDDTFGPGSDSDLVMRVSTTSIDIPRSEPVEAFYVRMYDGSTPPNYSLHSGAIFVNVPL